MGDKKAEKEFIAEFIEVYRGLPALWDVKCKDYTNRAKKGEQYDVLIEKYREKYPDAEKQEVVKKVNSLRTNFRKELKRIRDAERSGAGAEDVEPTLWYFDEMKFLVTQETPSASISTMDISQDVHDNEDRCDANETRVVDDESRQKNRKRKAPDPTEELVKLASKRLQQPQDDSDIVAAAWAVELRKMDPQQQLFAKKAINEILFEGQMGTLHRSSVEINVSCVATPYSVQSLPSPSFPQYESASASSQHTDDDRPSENEEAAKRKQHLSQKETEPKKEPLPPSKKRKVFRGTEQENVFVVDGIDTSTQDRACETEILSRVEVGDIDPPRETVSVKQESVDAEEGEDGLFENKALSLSKVLQVKEEVTIKEEHIEGFDYNDCV